MALSLVDPTQSPSADETVITVTPTIVPTAAPSSDPTISPSDNPSLSPSLQPTSDPTKEPTTSSTALQFVSLNGADLTECQGDCDWDTDCDGALLCWHRHYTDNGTIPGCTGDLQAIDDANKLWGIDYCYDATATNITQTPSGLL